MNPGMETETAEYKKSTGEMREGMESIASILNKHGHGTLYFGVRNDGEVIGQEASEKTLRAVSQAVGNQYRAEDSSPDREAHDRGWQALYQSSVFGQQIALLLRWTLPHQECR